MVQNTVKKFYPLRRVPNVTDRQTTVEQTDLRRQGERNVVTFASWPRNTCSSARHTCMLRGKCVSLQIIWIHATFRCWVSDTSST